MAVDDPQHRAETAERWAVRISADDWSPDQCGRCAFWAPLRGRWGLDWGGCTNAASANDARVTHEHDRCVAFVDAGDRWARTPTAAG